MEDQSNTKLLKQLTKRTRNPDASKNLGPSKKKSETADPRSENPAIKYIKASCPEFLKRPSAKVAFDVAVFGAAAFIIIKFGSEMATTFENITPSEQSVMRELKAAQD